MDTVVVEATYHAPVEVVWKALTDKDLMRKWYFDLEEFRAEKGFEFHFTGKGQKGEHYLHLCRVTEVIPLKKLQYSWTYDRIDGNSLVTFELFGEGPNTRLRITHSGLDSFPADNPDFAPESFNQGWNSLIKEHLKKFLATQG